MAAHFAQWRGTLVAGLVTATCALLAGCSATGSKAGIATPPAILYKHDTTPLMVKHEDGSDRHFAPIAIPDDLASGESTAYSFALNIPGVPGGSLMSIGWGDMSTEKAQSNGNIDEVLFADANELKILGIFTRTRVKAYGQPKSPQLAAADAE